MATVFMEKIVQKIYSSPAEAVLRAKATQVAKQKFDVAVDAMKQDFEDNLVTQEIAGGIGASNISKTLVGGQSTAQKNLYGFIGFPDGSDPLEPIREKLEPTNKFGPKMQEVGKDRRATSIRYQFKVTTPNEEAIWADTQVPWTKGGGFSWAKKIESYIPGFAYFLNRHMPNASDEVSRSKGGTQVDNVLRSASYKPPSKGFLQTIFKDFLERLRRFR